MMTLLTGLAILLFIYLVVANVTAFDRMGDAVEAMRRLAKVVEIRLQQEKTDIQTLPLDADKILAHLKPPPPHGAGTFSAPDFSLWDSTPKTQGHVFTTTLSRETIAAIQDALAEGALSKQAIADKFGASRHQVNRLAKKTSSFQLPKEIP